MKLSMALMAAMLPVIRGDVAPGTRQGQGLHSRSGNEHSADRWPQLGTHLGGGSEVVPRFHFNGTTLTRNSLTKQHLGTVSLAVKESHLGWKLNKTKNSHNKFSLRRQ